MVNLTFQFSGKQRVLDLIIDTISDLDTTFSARFFQKKSGDDFTSGTTFYTEPKAPFGRAPGAAPRAAPDEALPNGSFVTGFTYEVTPEAIGGLHRQGEAMKSWFHAAYTSI